MTLGNSKWGQAFTFLVLASVGQSAVNLAHADIVGGEDINSNDSIQNSIVALYQKTSTGGALCTATLINKNFALTAAHCVEHGVQDMVVIFGGDLHSDTHGAVRVIDAEIPRAWRETHSSDRDLGDIAIIRLEGQLPNGYHAAHLASSRTHLHAGDNVLLAGYGISNASTHEGAGRLRKTHVKVVDPDFGKTEMLFDQSQGSGACHGDSGGPAFLEKDGKLLLVGVTDRGHPASAPDDCRHQVVYAKVSAYRKWITDTTKEMRKSRR